MTINFLGAGGQILFSDDATVNVIPARATFYIGGDAAANGTRPRKMETSVTVESSSAAPYHYPKVTHVRFRSVPDLGLVVRGEIKNTLSTAILGLHTTIGVALFNRTGGIVGGGFSFLDVDLPPGRRVAFVAENGVGDTPPSEVATVKVSVDQEIP